MAKFGKKNKVKIDPLAYNIGLIGESGIGKTTVIKEMCEKLAGEDGYMFLECGKEDGADAIDGINYENVRAWESDEDEDIVGFDDLTMDIIENKSTDYADLRVIVIDTFDQLMEIAEPEVVRMHNSENPEKPVTSIKASFGGYMKGEDKALEIVLDRLWELKKVGVNFIIIGHTKSRAIEDPITGESYTILTTNMSQRYFNGIKTKLHFLGVASVDRTIEEVKTGKKDAKTKKDATKGVIKEEKRRITFRDDSYSIDSKSRFADIVPEIPLDSDELIKALEDAIKAELSKSGKSVADVKAEQEKEKEARAEKIAELEESKRAEKALKDVVNQIVDFFKANVKDNKAKIAPVLSAMKEAGYTKPMDIDDLDVANKILALCE